VNELDELVNYNVACNHMSQQQFIEGCRHIFSSRVIESRTWLPGYPGQFLLITGARRVSGELVQPGKHRGVCIDPVESFAERQPRLVAELGIVTTENV
jgi:hypothetical protein